MYTYRVVDIFQHFLRYLFVVYKKPPVLPSPQ